MLREVAYGLLAFVGFIYSVDWFLSFFDDPREPPHVRSKIPLFGHVVGMVRNGNEYFSIASKKTKAEIYTLRFVNTKIYVSNTRRLTPLIQKSSKTVSFRPFIQLAARVFGGASDKTYDIFGTDMVDDFAMSMKTSLAPGPHLDEQNMRMGNRAIIAVDELTEKSEVNLLEWIRHAVIQASSCGVFGARHPWRDPKVEAAFWTWHNYMPSHITKTDFMGKGYAAREVVFDAYREYYKEIPSDASLVVRERQRVLLEAGIAKDDADKNEATFSIAIFANTSPTMFWATRELFARPDILAEVREELVSQAVSGSKEDGFKVDVAALKQKCPLLLSVFQETQRMRHNHANIRKVVTDTLLDGRYLLKAGNFLQMPGQPIHMDKKTWGEDALGFNPHRFVPKAQGEKGSVVPGTFTSWGAAPHLCPARQFATTEILIMLALMALRVDLTPLGASGWDIDVKLSEMTSIPGPKTDIKVKVTPREEWMGAWSLEMGQSMTRISLASG